MKKHFGKQWIAAVFGVILAVTALAPGPAGAQGSGMAWALGEPAACVVAHGDGFWALTDGNVWDCRMDQPEPVLLWTAEAGAAIQWLFAGEGGEVLALCATRTDYTICRFDPAAESLSPAWHISAQNAPTGVVRRALWQEGTIVIEYQSDQIRRSDLLLFDTGSGQTTSRYGCDVSGLSPYQGGALLGAQLCYEDGAVRAVAYDIRSGALSPICELDAFPEAMCFEPSTQQIIVFASPTAKLLSTSGVPTGQAYVPVAYDAWDGRHCAVNAAHVLAVSDGNRLLAADLQSGAAGRAVQIARFNADGAEIKRFRLSHPEIPVQTVNMGYRLTPSMVAQLIRSHDTATDIYMVRTFEVGYSELLDKGFCADLSDQAELYAQVMRMPPALSSALTVDGRLMGVPVEIAFDPWTALLCSYETLDEAGLALRDVPANLPDLLDEAAEWYEDGRLDGVRLFEADDQAFALTWFVLNHHARYLSAQNRPLDYDTPLFKSLMAKCDRLCGLLAQQGGLDESSPFLFQRADPTALLRQDEDQRAFIPIVSQEGMQPRYAAYLTVAVLNPLSQNKEAALAYLQALPQELPAQTRLFFQPDQAQAVERADYQARREAAADEVTRLQTLLSGDALDIAGRNEIQRQLSDAVRWLEELDVQQRWALSPDAVRAYQSVKDGVFVSHSVVAELLDEAVIDAVRQYAAGGMAAAALAERIVRKARMMELERSGEDAV